MVSSLVNLLSRSLFQPDGFVASSRDAKWRLGAILFASRLNTFAAIRKASTMDGTYEFAGMYALPGGMVRAVTNPSGHNLAMDEILLASLCERVQREAGLQLFGEDMPRPTNLGPLITSYRAKGQKRYTLVATYQIEHAIETGLEVGDRSVDAAFWEAIPPVWECMAPANCLALAHLVWGLLGEEQRLIARPAIGRSLDQCCEWAAAIGAPVAVPPWADAESLAQWRTGWERL